MGEGGRGLVLELELGWKLGWELGLKLIIYLLYSVTDILGLRSNLGVVETRTEIYKFGDLARNLRGERM